MPVYHPSNAWAGLVIAAAAIVALGRSATAAAQTITEFTIPTPNSSPNFIAPGPDGALWFSEQGVPNTNGPFIGGKIGRTTTGGTITAEFVIPTGNSDPNLIGTGPDGALWFTESDGNRIANVTTSANFTEFLLPTTNSGPREGVPGPDGALWFAELKSNKIGRITTAGTITEFTVPTASSQPQDITAAPDGALWFTEVNGNKIGRITTAGTITEFTVPTANSQPQGIATGPDGALWFTESNANQIGRITTTGTIIEFTVPTAKSAPGVITAGPDGALWFTEVTGNKIGRIATIGTINEFAVPTASSGPLGIATGPDGALWFTESNANQIGRITVPVSTTSLFAAVLPSSRSVAVGNTATAFATMINTASTAATSCAIVPLTNLPANFVYQATNPQTNALTGTQNTPINIAANDGQGTFVVAFTANAPQSPTIVALGFDCDGTAAASSNVGLNTLLLSFSSSPVPDIVALAATVQNDGIVHVLGGAGAFAVATVDVGAGGAITVAANTGTAVLPLTLSLCQTNPSTGVCLAPPTPSVTTTIVANATPTFAIFAGATGTVPFLPATSRVFVQFSDASGAVRGSTSVAVETQ